MNDARGARIVRLIEDPNVGGDLLLVAVGLAAKYDFALDYGGTIAGLGRLLWSTGYMPGHQIRDVLRADARTYKPPTQWGRICTAPMIRRSGECGRGASAWAYLTDWETGEKHPIGACARHSDWFSDMSRANRAQKPESPPLPAANYGGALVAHFPRIDWRTLWRKLNPRWVEYPEVKPWPKPDLTLMLGDADTDASTDRPMLSVVQT